MIHYPEAFHANEVIGAGNFVFDANYVSGEMIYTRFRVLPPDGMYVKSWYATHPEPSMWTAFSLSDPNPEFLRWLVLELRPGAIDVDTPAEWRVDEVCLDKAPPPVLLAEAPPPETEHNGHPNAAEGGDPVDTFTGSLGFADRDVAIPGRGPVIDFQRTYNSNDPRVGPLGPGWTHSYATRLTLADDNSGDIYLIGPQGRSDRYTLDPDGSYSPPAAVHSQLVLNPDGTYTLTHTDQASWTFDSGGRLVALTDRFGNNSALTYTDGRLATISDPAGRGTLALTYTNGLLTSVTDWLVPARSVTYQYDANGRLWKVTDREGKTTTYTYDGTSHRLSTITNARGNVVLTNTYDAQGRVLTQKDARGLSTGDVTTFSYVVNPDGTRVTTITAPVTSFEPSFNPTLIDSYDANGWLVGPHHPTQCD